VREAPPPARVHQAPKPDSHLCSHPNPPTRLQSRTVLALMEPRVTPWADADSLEAWRAVGSLIGGPEDGA
jgi:hypothetical protein